jgi:hypothetical protein
MHAVIVVTAGFSNGLLMSCAFSSSDAASGRTGVAVVTAPCSSISIGALCVLCTLSAPLRQYRKLARCTPIALQVLLLHNYITLSLTIALHTLLLTRFELHVYAQRWIWQCCYGGS